MGACSYVTVSRGKTASEAYRNACDEARAENGHQEGYSGDIQTSEGFHMVPLPEVPSERPRNPLHVAKDDLRAAKAKVRALKQTADKEALKLERRLEKKQAKLVAALKAVQVELMGLAPKTHTNEVREIERMLPCKERHIAYLEQHPQPAPSREQSRSRALYAKAQELAEDMEKRGSAGCFDLGNGQYMFFGMAAE